MTNLIGVYECKIDEKGRLMLPAALRKQIMPVIQDGFIIKRSVFHKCLELYPMAEWNKESRDVSNLSRFYRGNVKFVTQFMAGVKPVDLDSAGRLLIPKELIAFAGINRHIVLSSSINIIELWDKDEYERVLEEGADTFADLAEEVMVNPKLKPGAPNDVP